MLTLARIVYFYAFATGLNRYLVPKGQRQGHAVEPRTKVGGVAGIIANRTGLCGSSAQSFFQIRKNRSQNRNGGRAPGDNVWIL
jgi:hypothetical protein